MAVVLALSCFGAGDRAASGSASATGGFKGAQIPANDDPHRFHLKAGGYFDFAAGTISFAGHATHLGQFTAAALLGGACF